MRCSPGHPRLPSSASAPPRAGWAVAWAAAGTPTTRASRSRPTGPRTSGRATPSPLASGRSAPSSPTIAAGLRNARLASSGCEVGGCRAPLRARSGRRRRLPRRRSPPSRPRVCCLRLRRSAQRRDRPLPPPPTPPLRWRVRHCAVASRLPLRACD
uniref:Uncharacterized protein n=1 Tax=Emiliania huxleyi (strain CCMP1516) TaxID=280463 RepID=A0A0D3JTH8_EMIH1